MSPGRYEKYLKMKPVFTGLLIFSAVALQAGERIFAGYDTSFEFGFANLATLAAIISWGKKTAFKVAAGRVILGSFLFGNLMSGGFYLSLAGSLSAYLAMIFSYKPFGKLSPVGVSVAGAAANNLLQFAAAYFIFFTDEAFFLFPPFFLLAAVPAGVFNGLLVKKIVPCIANYSKRKYYLSSGSPRRIKYMKKAGVAVIVVKPAVSEDPPFSGENPESYALRQALKKLESSPVKDNRGIIISADTVVEVGGEILGKPADENEARSMLKRLSGSKQKVHTAVAVKNIFNDKIYHSFETTLLKMRPLTCLEIEKLKRENLDKAGAYGIQGMKDEYFEWIQGSYSNVVGFPLKTVRELLLKAERNYD